MGGVVIKIIFILLLNEINVLAYLDTGISLQVVDIFFYFILFILYHLNIFVYFPKSA